MQLPEFPSGNGNMVCLVWDAVRGAPAVFNAQAVLAAVTKLLGGCSDPLWLVAHHLFSRPVLMKIAELPPVDPGKNETVVYATLEGAGITPRFTAHITESGRIVWFLVECFEGRAADDRDFLSCEKTLERLQDEGLVHNDAHLGNFVVKPDGTVLLIDFEYAQSCRGQWRFLRGYGKCADLRRLRSTDKEHPTLNKGEECDS
ncbi:hypothetical protein DL765_010120 [Monosporascus sp. GIB2]|nr:hypothetical protein DL765_010120 [Monosporascus sp. GIB2]